MSYKVKAYRIELEKISSPMADVMRALSRKHKKSLPIAEIDKRTLSALLSRGLVSTGAKQYQGKTRICATLTEKGQQLRKAI